MEYQALYRQFRPEEFSDMVGQEHIVRSLSNQIENGKVAHAYLFCGTRGTGKTTTARILSRAVNCTNRKGASPCNECAACKSMLNQSAVDVIEIDAASNNSVENVRNVIDEVVYPPVMLKYKVYIIDEVHMLSTGAFNALLKTLEEPPEHVIFILATTEYHKIPATILSRCQRFDFRRISSNEIKERLRYVCQQSNVKIDEDALNTVAYAADGSMRDGLSILDKCISFGHEEVTGEIVTKILGIVDDTTLFEISRAISKADIPTIIELSEKAIREGRDPILLTVYLIEHFRCLMIASFVSDPEEILQMSGERAARFTEYSKDFKSGEIINIVRSLSNLYKMQKESPNPKVILEIGLVSLTGTYNKQQAMQIPVMPAVEYAPKVVPVVNVPPVPENNPIAEVAKPEEKTEPEKTNVSLEGTDILSKWADVVAYISRGGNVMLSSAISYASPYENGEKLNIVFKKSMEVNKKIVDKSENCAIIEDAVYECTGKKVKVSFKLEDEASDFKQAPVKQVSAQEKLEKLAEKFPDIVKIEE